MGADPGPDGHRLPPARGVEAHHLSLLVTAEGRVAVHPAEAAVLRLGPAEVADWTHVPALQEPAWLPVGGRLHLGRPERGLDLRLVGTQPMGGRREAGVGPARPSSMPPGLGDPALEPPPSRRWPRLALGALGLVCAATAVMVGVQGFRSVTAEPVPLDPVEQGVERYSSVAIDAVPDLETREPVWVEAIRRGFGEQVMLPNAQAAGDPTLGTDRSRWDDRLRLFVEQSAYAHQRGWAFWRRLEQVSGDYGSVVLALRAAGLPEIMAGVPFNLSRFHTDLVGRTCEAGPWQLLPEVAHRTGLAVSGCTIHGRPGTWAPTDDVPPLDPSDNAPYVSGGRCSIEGCAVDERTDLARSTQAAMRLLQEAWRDPELARSGAAVQFAMTSAVAGLDDSKLHPDGDEDVRNIKPALLRWEGLHPDKPPATMLGAAVTCPMDSQDACGSVLIGQTQHFGYTAIAQGLLATCYYASQHGEEPAFQPWKATLAEGGWCRGVPVPARKQVLAH